jgi:hypothetical protein
MNNAIQTISMNCNPLHIMWLGAFAAPAADVDVNIVNQLQLLRSDFNSAKIKIVNDIMKLSTEDETKFWAIYRAYEAELDKLAINRAVLIGEFVLSQKDGSFDNAKAKAIAKRWFETQRARLDLLEKYHGKIEKSLSSIQAAQFLQIENQLGIIADLVIASEMPLVGGQKK